MITKLYHLVISLGRGRAPARNHLAVSGNRSAGVVGLTVGLALTVTVSTVAAVAQDPPCGPQANPFDVPGLALLGATPDHRYLVRANYRHSPGEPTYGFPPLTFREALGQRAGRSGTPLRTYVFDGGDERDGMAEPPEVELPEDAADLIAQLEAERGRDLTEQERNLAVAQANLIGDL